MIAYVFQKHPKNSTFQLFVILQYHNLPVKFAIFLKSNLLFQFLLSFLFINNTLWLNNLKTRTAMNAKISLFIICVVEAITHHIYTATCCW